MPAEDPHIELCFPTVHDPSLAPEGKHVVTIDVNSQPYHLRDGTGTTSRRRAADRADRPARASYFPDLPGLDRAPQVLSRSTWSG